MELKGLTTRTGWRGIDIVSEGKRRKIGHFGIFLSAGCRESLQPLELSRETVGLTACSAWTRRRCRNQECRSRAVSGPGPCVT